MRTWSIVGIASLLLFALLAALLHFAPEILAPVDSWVSALIVPLQTFTGIEFFLAATALGSAIGIIVIGTGFAYIGRLDPANTLRLMSLLIVVTVVERFVKETFMRTRPDALAWFDPLPSFSFPSAHAAAALALYGFIATVLYRRTRRARYAFLPALVIALVGLSRIVLNAHYFSDVIGGYLLGAILLAFSFLLPFERLTGRNHG
jgi:undecaprenyl-diphosphatase